MTDFGTGEDGENPPLSCHTDLTTCCKADTDTSGKWYFPDGKRVSSVRQNQNVVFTVLAEQRVRLFRQVSYNLTRVPTGFYCCEIPTTRGNMAFCTNIGEC